MEDLQTTVRHLMEIGPDVFFADVMNHLQALNLSLQGNLSTQGNLSLHGNLSL